MKDTSYFFTFVVLFATLILQLIVAFRMESEAFEFILSLVFLVVILAILFGAFFRLSWSWKLSSLYFIIFLLNTAYLFLYTEDQSLLIASMALIASLGFIFSVMNINKKSRKVELIPYGREYKPGKFVASDNGSVYHAPKCDWAKRIKRQNRLWFMSKADAKKKGYKEHSCLSKRA